MSNAKVTPATFFTDLLELVKDEIPADKKYVEKPDYCYCFIGSKDTHFECYFDEKTKSLRIGMHFESPIAEKNKELFDIVWKFRDIIEDKIGEEIIVSPHEKANWYIIGIKDKENCELSEEDKKWAAEKMKNFYNAIIGEPKKVIEALGKS